MFRWTILVGLCLTGCGGEPAARTADDADVDAETLQLNEPASEQAPASSEAAEAESSPESGQASLADVTAVLQLVIDDEALTPYLHLERPERFPLRVSSKNLPPGIELVKATKPVVLVREGEEGEKPVLEFIALEVSDNRATVRYRYDEEGVRGSCRLRKRDGRWELESSRVTER